MNCPPKNPTNPKYPLQLAYDLSDEKEKLELASFIIENSIQTDYVKVKEGSGLIGNLTPMHLAAMFGYEGAVTRIINKNSNEPKQADIHGVLLLVAKYRHLNTVQLLMTLTENPNAPRNNGWTSIHSAARNGHLEVVRLLMTTTTNPNAPKSNGETPIHSAASNGHLEVVRLLMTTTTIPNAPTNNGWTSIHVAARWGHLEVVRLLMTATDANPNAQTVSGKTPSDLAREFGHLEIEKELKAFSIIKDIPQYNFLFYSTMNNSK